MDVNQVDQACASTAGGSDAAVRPYLDVPGPKGLPLLGNAHQIKPESFHRQLEGWAHGGPDYGAKLVDALERRALLYLDAVREAAMRAGVACECVIAHGVSPALQITREARLRRCDLIVMSSHGARGAGGPAGSETLKVVAMGVVPVLAHNGSAEAAEPLRRPRAA